MRNKTPLALMEQLVMVLVFALAAAVCVQVFVLSDGLSRTSAARARALVEAQNAAEILKSLGGDYQAAAAACGGVWNGQILGWSLETGEASGEETYHVLVTPADSGSALLGRAEVSVYAGEGTLLAALPVAWQEVSGADG